MSVHAIAATAAEALTVALLIINADDFGLTRGVSEGILEAHTGGVVTSTSLMVLASAASDAARAAMAHPRLSVGLHFAEDRPEILDCAGKLAEAFRVQLERFRELTGHDPTHVDSHHHVHITRMGTFKRLVAPLGIPLRAERPVAFVSEFYAQSAPGRTDLSRVSRERLLALLEAHAERDLVELACHPGKVTDELSSSYREERAAELTTLTEPGLREQLRAAGFQLASFGDVARGVTKR